MELRGLGSKETQLVAFPWDLWPEGAQLPGGLSDCAGKFMPKLVPNRTCCFFSFLLARLFVSNLAFTNVPNMSLLQPYPSLRSFLKKNAGGLWRGWLGNCFSQPDLVRHRRRLGVCFLISNKTVFVFMKVCICGWLQSKQPPGLHDETLETTRPHWSAGCQPSTVFAFLLRKPI